MRQIQQMAEPLNVAQQYIIEQNQRVADQMLPPIQAEMLRAGDPRLIQAAIDSLHGGQGAAGAIPRGGQSDEFLSADFGSPISNALKEYGGKAVAALADTPPTTTEPTTSVAASHQPARRRMPTTARMTPSGAIQLSYWPASTMPSRLPRKKPLNTQP
mgnify:CR=1 FL=1